MATDLVDEELKESVDELEEGCGRKGFKEETARVDEGEQKVGSDIVDKQSNCKQTMDEEEKEELRSNVVDKEISCNQELKEVEKEVDNGVGEGEKEGKIGLIRAFFGLVTEFNIDPEQYEKIFHRRMVETEFPNLLSPRIRIRSAEEGLKGIAMGKTLLEFQRYDIQSWFESRNMMMTVEVIWTGKMKQDAGRLRKGQDLKAHVCFVFEFEDGKVLYQRHYDCFEPI